MTHSRVPCAPVLAVVAVLALLLSPVAAAAYLTLPVAAFAYVGGLVITNRLGLAVEVVVWCYFLAPLARRMVELQIGFHQQNLLLLVPVAASLPLTVALWWTRTTMLLIVRNAVGMLTACLFIGAAVGLAKLPLTAAVTGMSGWLPPFVVGLVVLVAPLYPGELEDRIGRIGLVGGFGIGGYGLVQWLVVPKWDATWLRNVLDTSTSFGRPEPEQIRVFSTLNSPGPAALVLLFCVVAALGSPGARAFKVLSVTLAVVSIGLSEVRQAYIALMVVALIAVVRRLLAPSAVIVAAALGTLLVLAVPALSVSVGERVTGTVSAGSDDRSLNARADLQRSAFPVALRAPAGSGIGSVGAGQRASNSSSDLANPDSGFLELVGTFGLFLTIIYLSGVLILLRVARWSRGSRLGAALLALSATFPIQLFTGNVFTGPVGVCAWVAIFGCIRVGADARNDRLAHNERASEADE